jgi:(p)ppGpp synthase/HD superfamily hydrolase
MMCGIGIIATAAAFLAESFIGRPPRPRVPQRSRKRPVLGREFERAFDFAMDIHGNDIRGRENDPFIAHLLSVTSLVLSDGGSQDEAIAALLHDAPEGVHKNEIAQVFSGIRHSFGEPVALIVERCSGPIDGPPWRKQRAEYLDHLRDQTDQRVLRVALAKELDNARMLLRELRKYGDVAWKRADASEADVHWFYDELSSLDWRGIQSPMIAELKAALADIRALNHAIT